MRVLCLSLLLATLSVGGCPKPQPDPQRPRHQLDPDLIPRKVIFGNPKKSALQISPDGKRISYLAPRKGVMNVWVQTIGANDARAVTADTYRGIRSYFWTPDGKSIAFVTERFSTDLAAHPGQGGARGHRERVQAPPAHHPGVHEPAEPAALRRAPAESAHGQGDPGHPEPGERHELGGGL